MISGWAQSLAPLTRLAMFRLTLTFSALFGLTALVLFAFIYWQTAVVETRRVDHMLIRDAEYFASQPPDRLRDIIESRVTPELRRITYVGLFNGAHRAEFGNFPVFPETLPIDGLAHRLVLAGPDGQAPPEIIRAIGIGMADGATLMVGRNVDSLDNLARVVKRALGLGLIPALLLSLGAGIVISQRTNRQVQKLHETARRIMNGDLKERLPIRGSGDDFDRLADSVNLMLDEIARLMEDMKATGDNIAHDLRTPLTRVRTRLERARDSGQSQEDWHETVDRAIVGLDQALRLITALLRIGEIEGGQRRAAFEELDLAELARELVELYDPIAEEKGLLLTWRAPDTATDLPISGDRDLLCELLANLLDNAIKFTPAGGLIAVEAQRAEGVCLLAVRDSGPGIPPEQREAVFQRFYRADISRSVTGHGLGLSLSRAIVILHGFTLTIEDNHPGCVFLLRCPVTQ